MFIGYHRERVSESQTKTIEKTSNNTQRREDSGENLVNIVLKPHFLYKVGGLRRDSPSHAPSHPHDAMYSHN